MLYHETDFKCNGILATVKSTIFPDHCALPLKEFVRRRQLKVRTIGIGMIAPWNYDVIHIESAPSQNGITKVYKHIAIAFVSIFKQSLLVYCITGAERQWM